MTKTRRQVLAYLDSKFGKENYQLYTPDDVITFNEDYWEMCEWGQIGALFNKISPPPIAWSEIEANA
jgi:hypothetical protein